MADDGSRRFLTAGDKIPNTCAKRYNNYVDVDAIFGAKDLVYDVGMHNGDDTAHYLSQGYRVVAVEADPALVKQAQRRFAEQMAANRLSILNVGVAEQAGMAEFWICERLSVWNSFDRAIASRDGSPHHCIEIPTKRFADILQQYGTPYYLKIDIEGCDHLCIRDLDSSKHRPRFISVESECGGGDHTFAGTESLAMLDLLCGLGYTRFKLVSQYDFYVPPTRPDRLGYGKQIVESMAFGRLRALGLSTLAVPFTRRASLARRTGYWFESGSSGPWGDQVDGRWMNADEARDLYVQARAFHFRKSSVPAYSFWCDWHATF